MRALSHEIMVDVDPTASEIVLVIHRIGGVHTELRAPRRRRGQNSTHTAPETPEAVRSLARMCSDAMIASVSNRNARRTGRGNFWTRERVAALRSHHQVPVCSEERRAAEGWLNLTQAAGLIGVSARTLRLAVEHGNLSAEHLLPDGPWIFRRDVLLTEEARKLVAKARGRSRRPAVPTGSSLKGYPLNLYSQRRDEAVHESGGRRHPIRHQFEVPAGPSKGGCHSDN